MKKALFLLSVLALGSATTFAQAKKPTKTNATAVAVEAGPAAEAQSKTTISFEKTVYDFGTIAQGIPAEAEFVFTNTGKEPLVLQNVKAACGCTTPYYTKETVMPGKKGVVKASYNAAAAGGFDKPVTVTYNGGTVNLSLKGTVEKAPENSVPTNNSSMMKK